MSDGKNQVADNVVVSLEYVLHLDDKSEIDSSEDGSPLLYLHGYQNIIPGLEEQLTGMNVGDEKDVVVPPNLGYGDRKPESVVEYPRDSFPPSMNVEVGEPVMLRDDQSGEQQRAYISEIHPDTVLLDFNHPLAGETLHFHVKIAGLREPTQEELTHGHVHDGGHGH